MAHVEGTVGSVKNGGHPHLQAGDSGKKLNCHQLSNLRILDRRLSLQPALL